MAWCMGAWSAEGDRSLFLSLSLSLSLPDPNPDPNAIAQALIRAGYSVRAAVANKASRRVDFLRFSINFIVTNIPVEYDPPPKFEPFAYFLEEQRQTGGRGR